MRNLTPPAGSRPPYENRTSAHSLHTIGGSNHDLIHPSDGIGAGEDGEEDDDGRSTHSSRSDQSLEAAGLVSRLSDEQERANRHAKYEGSARLGNAASMSARAYRFSDEEDGQSMRESNHGIADGVFRDRSSADRRPASRRELGVLKRTWHISREALPTLSISLVSLVFSGELLVHLARWPVFSKVDKLFILLPILLNLKGNLEGNLSLRLSTSANIGELDIRRTRETLIFGNMALLQVQALIVSLFAGILSFILGIGGSEGASDGSKGRRWLSPRRVIHHHPTLDPSLKLRNSYFEFVLVIATGMLSASLSSAILGSFMCALVVVTRQLGGNPDNIASPLAGSLGDLLTLSLLGLIGSFLVHFEGTILATIILLVLALACATCFIVTYRNAYVRELLSSGWVPLVIAMFISSGAGLVLDAFVQEFQGFALLAPVVTGLPGACSAIFVSRISTALHSGKGDHEPSVPSLPQSTKLRRLFAGNSPTEGWLVPCTLFAIGLAIMTFFVVFVHLTGQMGFGWPFYLTFITVSSLIMVSSLALTHFVTLALWRRDYDPDIYCLPYITSMIDVVGQCLLVLAYYLAMGLGDHITAAVNDHGK